MKKIYIIPTLAFSALTGMAQTEDTVFTASGVFTVPTGVTEITIEIIGAGGSGGGNGTGGGGGGGYSKGDFTVVPGTILPVTIGAAGGELLSGTTSVGTLISANGGINGVSVPNPSIGGGGAGGTATGGTINHTGGDGGGGYYTYFGGGGGGAAGPTGNGGVGGNTIAWTGVCMTPGGTAGTSGGAPGGAGGKGAGFTDASCSVTDPAGDGISYGGGGGGGNGNGGGPGVGSPGYCKISWEEPSGVGINHPGDKNKIVVSPNPFTHSIQVQNATGNEQYELTSISGQVIWTGTRISQHDFSTLKNGLYILNVKSAENSQALQLIKQ